MLFSQDKPEKILMQFPLIQNLFAERVGGLNYGKNCDPNKFEKTKRTKQEAVIGNPYKALIDLSLDEPDWQDDPQVIESFYQETKDCFHFNRDNSCPEFTVAVAQFMQRVFGVLLDPTSEVVQSNSSKSALSILLTCFLNPGEVVLMTKPGYPFCDLQARYCGGVVYNLPVEPSKDYCPDFSVIPPNLLTQAKVLVLPNNPTGACATFEFFEKIVHWAKTHNIMIIHDAAYACLAHENRKPLSIFQVKQARDIAVELHSLAMPGWRATWVCGNPLIMKALKDIKNNTDPSQCLLNQKMVAKGLTRTEIFKKIALKYSRRMDLLFDALDNLGLSPIKPKAGLVLYCPCPKSSENGPYSAEYYSAFGFSQWLVRNELISVLPWDDVVPSVGFSVAFSASCQAQENKFIDTMYGRLMKYKFRFR